VRVVVFLHFYQPPNQQYDILDRVVNECYRPVVRGLLDRPAAKIVVNISGGLTQLLLDNKYDDVVNGMKRLIEGGQVEFTDSAKFHAFLPLLPEREVVRQIKKNSEVNRKVFGNLYNPSGFFPPELAVNDCLIKTVSKLGYKWIAVPEVAYGSGPPLSDRLFRDTKTGITVFFRNKRVSALILSALARSADDLIRETRDLSEHNKYFFTVMDAETFGHHRIGHEKLLFEILDSEDIKAVTASDLLMEDFKYEGVNIRASTWTNEEQDFWLDKERKKATESKSYILWKDPDNPIHKLQWEFVDLCINTITSVRYKNAGSRISGWKKARQKLDIALASDQFWWASAKPWWSLEMIESGAYDLKDVIFTLNPDTNIKKKAEKLYQNIIAQAFEWQRTGYIRKRHLESSATHMKDPFNKRAPAEWYNQVILEFEDEMKKAAGKREFEKAIKWRDALIKLNLGTDIYDVLHVVDELWTARQIPSVKPFLSHNWEEFSEYAKGQFRDVKSREEFLEWAQKRFSRS